MKLRTLAAEQRVLLIGGIALSLVGTFAMLFQPLVVGSLINTLTSGGTATTQIVTLVLLFSVDIGCGALGGYLVARAGENIVLDLRVLLMNRILRAKIPAVTSWDRGDLFTRASADTSLARVALSSSFSQLATSLLSVIGCLTLMFFLDIWLATLTVVTIAVTATACVGLVKAVRRTAVQNRQHNSDFGSIILSQLSNLETVKAYLAEPSELNRSTRAATKARGSGLKVARLAALLTPIMNVGTQLSLALVIIVGAARVSGGGIDIQALVAFILYLLYLVSPLVVALMSISQFQQGRAALDRVNEVAEIETEGNTTSEEVRPSGEPFETLDDIMVCFKDVSFTYPGRIESALENIDLSFTRKGSSAIVGPSGSGKSTIFKLLERFYDTDAGTIVWNGNDIRSTPLHELRQNIGFVSQEGSLMRGSILDNMMLGSPDASRYDLWNVLDQVGLAEVVRNLPHGLEETLGDEGSGLSGGQRQRLAIARVLLRKPKILLLDEATSHLDSDSETIIAGVIQKLAEQLHVVLIAHRLSTITKADCIYVLENGAITGAGIHDHLMQKHTTYRRLVDQQLNSGVHHDPEIIHPKNQTLSSQQ